MIGTKPILQGRMGRFGNSLSLSVLGVVFNTNECQLCVCIAFCISENNPANASKNENPSYDLSMIYNLRMFHRTSHISAVFV